MAKYHKYKSETMANAVQAVKNGMSCAAASRTYNVPRVTLLEKVKGKSEIFCKSGVETILTTNEEKYISDWIISLGKAGFPVIKEQLLDSVAALVKKLNCKNNFNAGRPGRHWYEGYLKRHPEISQRMTQNLIKTRADVSEISIRNWFKEIGEYFANNNIEMNDPRRIFNADETAFFLCPKAKKALVKKGTKAPYSFIPGNEKECVTVLITANAAGELPPPMVMFAYERIPKAIITNMPDNWSVGKSQSGWMTSESFFEYVTNIFHPWLLKNNISLPVIFYVDGHKSHVTFNLSEFCSNNNIILVSLLPNSTHMLQPLDVGVFHPLKNKWKSATHEWRLKNSRQTLKRENFTPLLNEVLKETFTSNKLLKSAFRTCGLFPFDVNQVDFSKLLTDPSSSIDNISISRIENNLLGNTLKYFESIIDKNKLALFYKGKDKIVWEGDIEDTSLFFIWLKMYNSNNEQQENDNLNNTDLEITTKDDLNLHSDSVAENVTKENELIRNNLTTEINTDNCIVLDGDWIEELISEQGTDKGKKNTVFIENSLLEILNENELETKQLEGIQSIVLPSDNPKPSENYLSIQQKNMMQEVKELLQEAKKELQGIPDINSNLDYIENYIELPEIIKCNADNKRNNNEFVNIERNINSNTQINNNETYMEITEESINSNVANNSNKKVNKKDADSDVNKKLPLPNIPSPFKSTLFWPEPKTITPKKLKFKIPSVASSEQWKNYYKKKQDEKKEKEKENEEKKRKREEIKTIKNQIKKTKVDGVQVKNKKGTNSNQEKVQGDKISPRDGHNTRNFIQEEKNLKKDSYVIVQYEGEKFPGIVEKLEKKKAFVSVMVHSGIRKWKWPSEKDELWYNFEDILEVINDPIATTNRGVFSIPEMDKHLCHIFI